MWPLLGPVSLRRIREHTLRSGMTVLGVALGVAVLVGVIATNRSILGSFRDTLGNVGGKVHLEVRGGDTGLPEELVETVRQVAGVRYATVAVQRTLDVPSSADPQGRRAGEAVAVLGINFTEDPKVLQHVYGITRDQIGQRDRPAAAAPTGDDFDNPLDVLDQPRQLVVSEQLAAKYGKKKGDTLTLLTKDGEQPFTLFAVTPTKGPQKAFGGNLALMDYLDAQEVFGLAGRIDRIDVTLTDPEAPGAVGAVAARIRTVLHNKYEVEPPSARQARQQQLLHTFNLALTIGAGVALMVGMFLIYHTLSISVAQRRSEIGILRANGATRGQVVRLFTLEGVVFGLVGSLVGVVLGRWLATLLMRQAASSITDIYTRVHAQDVQVEPAVAGLAIAVGVLASAVAALWPAWQASTLSPIETIRTVAWDSHGPPSLRFGTREWAAVAAFAAAPLVAQGPPIAGFPWLGMVAMFLVLLGATLMARWVVVAANGVLARPMAGMFGLEGRLAVDNVARGASKGAVTVASLMVGLSMVIASSTMTHAFQRSIDQWIEQAVPADLFVTAGARLGGIKNQPIDASLADRMAEIPGIRGVDKVRLRNVDYKDTRILLLSVDVRLRFALHKVAWTVARASGDKDTVLDRLQRGEGVVVSETLSYRYGLQPGASIELQTPQGRKPFVVLGTIIDYSSDQGAVFIDRALYQRHWQDDLVDTFEPYIQPGADIEQVRGEILRRFGGQYRLFVLTNAEFRAEIRRMIGQLFDVMRALELVTVVISLLSVVNTLLTAVLDRVREIGVLRAIGMVRRQLMRMILIESLGLSLVAAFVGLLAGLVNGTIMLRVVNQQRTGWNVPVQVPLDQVALYCAVLVVVGVLAAVYPARVAGKLRVVEALGYE